MEMHGIGITYDSGKYEAKLMHKVFWMDENRKLRTALFDSNEEAHYFKNRLEEDNIKAVVNKYSWMTLIEK